MRITPTPMTIEELARIWSVLALTKFRLSLIYQASVVLIERDTAVSEALPDSASAMATRAGIHQPAGRLPGGLRPAGSGGAES